MTYRTTDERGRVADDMRETILVAAQQAVKLRQFPAFSLVAHPDLLTRVPSPWPMQQKEHLGALRNVFLVELLDPFNCEAQ